MTSRFGSVDREQWSRRITREDWNQLPSSEYLSHLTACPDCQHSLFLFLHAGNAVDYHSQPCFHVAYYSADVPERCLDADGGLYAIIKNGASREGIVIGFCPWCGVKLPVDAFVLRQFRTEPHL